MHFFALPLAPTLSRIFRPDDSTYDTVFQTKSGHALILRVHFPPQSGSLSKPPAMQLVGVRATHAWLDTRMRVTGYQPITSASAWASSGIKLGNAVNTVVQHFQLKPPSIIEITDESLKRIQNSIAQQNQGGGGSSSGHGRDEPPPDYNSLGGEEEGVEAEMCHMPIPAVPASFPELDNMSRAEMQELLDDDDKFNAFVENMSAVTTLNDLKESIFKGNVETAETNLKREEEVRSLHAEVSALQDSLKEKVEVFRELEARQAELCAPPDRRTVIKKLTQAKKEAFDESEELASIWVDDGEMDIDEFVEKFLERRTVHHIRAAKIERLNATM